MAYPGAWPELGLSGGPGPLDPTGAATPGGARARDVPVAGPRRFWEGPLDVESLAVASVREAARAATALAARRGRPVALTVDSRDVAAAFDSFGHLRVDGRALVAWAPLSGFLPAADGWVRVHANYPHHRLGLLAALDVGGDDDESVRPLVADAVAALPARAVEARVRAHGGVAAALRTAEEWRAHEHGRVATAGPLVEVVAVTDASRPLPGYDGLPMAGLRVLDLTRVIAGPTATRVLAALGADVLRVDPPGSPELLDQHLDTGFAKRSAVADLADPAARATLEELLGVADVVVTGYRPGALARFGLDGAALLERHPTLVVAELSAWGATGPWAHERGFDSIVQAATGIGHRYGRTRPGAPGEWAPGALPVQALDHASGYLLAATAMRLLERRNRGGAFARISLARVAA